jgi:hypothetical protein
LRMSGLPDLPIGALLLPLVPLWKMRAACITRQPAANSPATGPQ